MFSWRNRDGTRPADPCAGRIHDRDQALRDRRFVKRLSADDDGCGHVGKLAIRGVAATLTPQAASHRRKRGTPSDSDVLGCWCAPTACHGDVFAASWQGPRRGARHHRWGARATIRRVVLPGVQTLPKPGLRWRR